MNFNSRKEIQASYLRTFVFGVEDSLASTVGLLSGVAAAGSPRETIILTGVVLIFVEAVSMSAGSFLSESSADDYLGDSQTRASRPVREAAIMFGAYVLSGFIPLSPYLFVPGPDAFSHSLALSAVALALLGAASATLSRSSPVKSTLRMLIIGGIAIAVGILVGSFLATY
ncbi:MAG: hypothetical protein COV10_03305 [Candidatus Vogelbacteria bacterium CG10_big_fil_rev_8_21_14_0_10_51_16]|uniref:VIT family protein n=1 Tax=Candidatus Vogelbacteria bacterium CG10_big_fil_rev_8_21_14_0_10_51_16 TaxID=1975045 RepID=A0A2H0RF88_9BACT|nr:MAG: hypothetical protein COV10_03305 [Candidatus Vogelbacteria bacterium CG10_big_fil_rev_8_21_14_0_10_51_16]